VGLDRQADPGVGALFATELSSGAAPAPARSGTGPLDLLKEKRGHEENDGDGVVDRGADGGAWSHAVLADTAEAMCEVRKDGEVKKDATGPCDFSQRQGYISISLRNGDRIELAPAKEAGHLKDQKGNKVVLTSRGNANEYKWEGGKKITVTFDAGAQSSSSHGSAGSVDTMLADRRARAAEKFGVSAGSVEVKYEGQRTDATHAINGSTTVHGRTETFQCSYDGSGRQLVNFVVSTPHGGGHGGHGASASQRAGEGDFDARGQVPCAQHKGQPMGQCDFGVTRSGNGTATVVITRPDGRTRAIYFENGKAIGADTSQADGYGEFRAEKEADLHRIRVGDERYEIPEAVIYGG